MEGGEVLAHLPGRSQRPSRGDSPSAAVRAREAGGEWQFLGVIFPDYAERDVQRRLHVVEFTTFADERPLSALGEGRHLSREDRGTIRWPRYRETRDQKHKMPALFTDYHGFGHQRRRA